MFAVVLGWFWVGADLCCLLCVLVWLCFGCLACLAGGINSGLDLHLRLVCGFGVGALL